MLRFRFYRERVSEAYSTYAAAIEPNRKSERWVLIVSRYTLYRIRRILTFNTMPIEAIAVIILDPP